MNQLIGSTEFESLSQRTNPTSKITFDNNNIDSTLKNCEYALVWGPRSRNGCQGLSPLMLGCTLRSTSMAPILDCSAATDVCIVVIVPFRDWQVDSLDADTIFSDPVTEFWTWVSTGMLSAVTLDGIAPLGNKVPKPTAVSAELLSSSWLPPTIIVVSLQAPAWLEKLHVCHLTTVFTCIICPEIVENLEVCKLHEGLHTAFSDCVLLSSA